jgi:hypothetical protein
MTTNNLYCVAALTIILLSNLGNIALGETISAVDAALPDELLGWRTVPDERVVYNRETLYDYIDGSAELYLSYGFHHLVCCRYVQMGEPDIVVDLFDMGTSQNAFGVFSQSREVIEDAFGQGSQYTEGLLLFWKGRYYVSILSSPETGRSKDAVFELARMIASAIPDEGPLPDVLARLPREGLVEESVRYFRHYIWLNSHYYVADENILHIDDTTHAVLAKYRRDREGGTEAEILLVVRYPDEAAAAAAHDEFVAQYLPERSEGPAKPAVRIEDGTWSACRARGDLVAVVFNAPSEEGAVSLIGAVLESN